MRRPLARIVTARKARRGVALVQALMVVALLATLATALLLRAGQGIERLATRSGVATAGEMLEAARFLALAPLGGGGAQPTLPGGAWQGQSEPEQSGRALRGGRIGWQVADLQGRFNLGWLGLSGTPGEAAREAFERLAREAGLSSALQGRIIRAFDPDAITRAGAFGSRSAPDLPLLVPALLLPLAPQAERARLAAILPLLAALPAGTGFNPNTAAPEVLAALWPGLDAGDWRAFAEARDRRLLASDEAVRLWIDSRSASPGAGPPGLEIGSQWFELRLVAWLDSVVLRRSAVVTTDPGAVPPAARRPDMVPGAGFVLLEWPDP